MEKKRKVLFIYKSYSPFIETDILILKKHFEVKCFAWKGLLNICNIIELIRETKKADVSFIWFEYYRSLIAVLIAKIFRKKSVIVAAGAVTLAQEWKTQKHLVKGYKIPCMLFFSKLAVKLADKVLAVSEYKKAGILNHVDLDNIEVVYNCFDNKKYFPMGEKENVILTISFITKENIERKGLITFLKLSSFFPDYKFIIVGKDLDNSSKVLTAYEQTNTEVITDFENIDLISYMQKAYIYAQLSSMESFGAALAEAMLCECVPVVTDMGSLPEVVGDVGCVCTFNDIESSIKAIQKAIDNPDLGRRARERINANFPFEKREEIIKDIILKVGI